MFGSVFEGLIVIVRLYRVYHIILAKFLAGEVTEYELASKSMIHKHADAVIVYHSDLHIYGSTLISCTVLVLVLYIHV